MKGKVRKGNLRRTRKLLESKFCGRETNISVDSLVRYSGPFLKKEKKWRNSSRWIKEQRNCWRCPKPYARKITKKFCLNKRRTKRTHQHWVLRRCNNCYLVNFAVPADHTVKSKRKRKRQTNTRILPETMKVTVIQIVVDTLGMITKILERRGGGLMV